MKATRETLGVLVLAGLMFVMANVAAAQTAPTPMTVTIDENGNGLATFPNADGTIQKITLPSFIGPDLGPGGLPNALQYEWPLPAFVPGDLILLEPSANVPSSDLVRFNNVAGAAPILTIAFYSDLPETTTGEIPALADVGFPTGLWTNLVRMDEQGVEESWNGAIYTPGPNDPGFIPGFQTTYEITSDVPEPATLCLLVMGGLALLRRKRGYGG
jgi:hypothetical protein